MGRKLRMYEPDATYFVTARTTQGFFLIPAVAEVNEIIGDVLARAARLFNVDVHAVLATSNHLHLVSTNRHCSLPACRGQGRARAVVSYFVKHSIHRRSYCIPVAQLEPFSRSFGFDDMAAAQLISLGARANGTTAL